MSIQMHDDMVVTLEQALLKSEHAVNIKAHIEYDTQVERGAHGGKVEQAFEWLPEAWFSVTKTDKYNNDAGD